MAYQPLLRAAFLPVLPFLPFSLITCRSGAADQLLRLLDELVRRRVARLHTVTRRPDRR
jgi:hypothetical protein